MKNNYLLASRRQFGRHTVTLCGAIGRPGGCERRGRRQRRKPATRKRTRRRNELQNKQEEIPRSLLNPD